MSNLSLGRAEELDNLLKIAGVELIDFVNKADVERNQHLARALNSECGPHSCLVHPQSSSQHDLESSLESFLNIRDTGAGLEGLPKLIETILEYSVNTSAPGFLDKLYAAPLPPGILAELVLGVLNTNVHVYQVSPVLTLIEKHVARHLAHLFGLRGPRSGGISVQGGSASNMTSIVIARNTVFPETRTYGNSAVKGRLILFTSAHGHYSIEKAAQSLGFGSSSVITVPVDEDGRMLPEELSRMVAEAKSRGDFPFYVNATAGTTVLGSFDPFEEIANVARKHNLWLHIDGAWGGGFVFSNREQIRNRLQGTELADSIAINPHKMLGVPMTCSFLLGKDLEQFQRANTLKAGYLFHDETGSDNDIDKFESLLDDAHDHRSSEDDDLWASPYDLADLTLQCGRRGDALKLFLCWQYHGTKGYSEMVDNAYDVACYMSRLVKDNKHLTLLSREKDPSCLQVCFYFTPNGRFTYGLLDQEGIINPSEGLLNGTAEIRHYSRGSRSRARLGKLNSRMTASISKALIPRGFMIDFAPALEGQEDRGSFFRVVVNISTIQETASRLIGELVTIGTSLVREIEDQSNGLRRTRD
ncbi:Glutamate decarboxylase 2 [Lithohypha guttulata]|uniref:Glutamate decarboxylase 2 n=1 Tax=Lithohypha guttulata TaxID=1690604 RepID=A0AAN7SVL2_9EURO|nr:Glutamate decarboxylase 2 [Lithohypha guttulata]